MSARLFRRTLPARGGDEVIVQVYQSRGPPVRTGPLVSTRFGRAWVAGTLGDLGGPRVVRVAQHVHEPVAGEHLQEVEAGGPECEVRESYIVCGTRDHGSGVVRVIVDEAFEVRAQDVRLAREAPVERAPRDARALHDPGDGDVACRSVRISSRSAAVSASREGSKCRTVIDVLRHHRPDQTGREASKRGGILMRNPAKNSAGVPGLEPRTTEGLWLSGLLRANLLEPRIHTVLTAPVYGLMRVDTTSFGPRERV